MRDNRTGSIFYPNYSISPMVGGNDQVIVGNIIDTKDSVGIEMINFYYHINTPAVDLNVKSVVIEEDDDLGFLSPTVVSGDKIIGDPSKLVVDLTGQSIYYSAAVGIKGNKRYLRQTVTFDMSGGGSTESPAIFSYMRLQQTVLPAI